MYYKKLSLSSILDLTPTILRYDLKALMIICPHANDYTHWRGEWFLFRCSWTIKIYEGMLGNTAPDRCVTTMPGAPATLHPTYKLELHVIYVPHKLLSRAKYSTRVSISMGISIVNSNPNPE
ncbi:hypothetical protein H8356DRAFT_1420946 [Neocallimastix lanati (nom. inval.)]|nr:hypothetical protein H8356DRAFT_1420946 [Neocallimastix sp. JGI-2020a]